MHLEPVIGLEVHVQLRTQTKIFCRCPNRFGAEPNTLVCPVCLGYPGTLPIPNHQAIELAVRLASALGCKVRQRSVFARKNYFYADLPKGYQISQFEEPLAEFGRLPLSQSSASVSIVRLHLEEDAGKLLHESPGGGPLPGKSLVDFNRCGVPLVEIVSAPEIRSPADAADYLQTLHQVLLYTETSDGNMEEGSLRCDANVSLRPVGESRLGTKTEIKNLNSFRNVVRALEYEIERQGAVLEAGGQIGQETRTFDASSGSTRTLRSKEEAHDYRYFPDPDLLPVQLTEERVSALVETLPELPWQRRERFCEVLGLSLEDAALLTASRTLADYFEAALEHYPARPKAVANWIMTEVLREAKARSLDYHELLPAASLAELVELVEGGTLSSSAAKSVLAEMWGTQLAARAVVDQLGLAQVQDESRLSQWVAAVVADHPGPVAELRAGKEKVLGFLVGQVMRRSQGRADPQKVRALLREVLPLESLQAKAEEVS